MTDIWAIDHWKWTEAQIDTALAEVLTEHGALLCPTCGRAIDRGDVAWNNGETEAGTGYSVVEVICQGCDTEIAHVDSWYPSIDDFADVVYVLNKDWGQHA